MIEIFPLMLFGIALAGSLAAGLWDLKTSDIPDEIVAIMGILGIFIWYVYALTFGDFLFLQTSLILGTTLLAAGWLIYNRGLWGLGDATLLAAIFYLLPDFAFFMDYMFNLVFVMLAYVIVYIIIVGLRTKGAFGDFTGNIRQKRYSMPIVLVIILSAGFAVYGQQATGAAAWFVAVPILLVFAVYSRSIEKKAFRKRIPASMLREGDVLLQSKQWKGLEKHEV